MKPGRNEPCPCGSGKKYKKCCALTRKDARGTLDADSNGPAVPPDAADYKTGVSAPPDLAALLGLLNAGRVAQAESMARDLIVMHPDSGLAWKLWGASLHRLGKDALQAFQRAAELLANDPESHCNLGNLLRARGRAEDAAASHRRAIEVQPDYAEAHNNLGSALLDLGRAEEAIECYRRALRFKPDFAMAHNNLGLALQRLGRFEEAFQSHRRALVMKPDFAQAHANLGEALGSLGRLPEALASYRRALETAPSQPEWLNAQGNILLGLRRFDEAVASYRRVLEIRPDFAAAHNNLGNALRELRQFDAAVASFRQAILLMPGMAQVHNNLGNALLELGRVDDAVKCYSRAIELKPDFAKALSNLGSAYQELCKFQDAESSYRRSLALNPDAAEVYTNLGTVQRITGRPGDAEISGRRAFELLPNSPATLVLLADLEADHGRFADAERLYRQAIAIESDWAAAWAGICGLRKMTVAEDAALLAELQRIVARRPLLRDEVRLRYAIGKFYDDTRDFERAFASYRCANELKKHSRVPYDRSGVARGFEAIRQFYDANWVNRMRAETSSSARPVFIVGMPRSGTSLAEQILASHPAVFGAGELSFWGAAAAQLRFADQPDDQAESIVKELAGEYLALLGGLSAEALRVVDKMPGNFLHVGLIHAALPHARIIHMRRNPIDTCLSIYFQNFNNAQTYSSDFEDLAHYYTEYEGLMRHWRAVLPADALLDLPYESLVDDPQAWSRTMVEFVGLNWDPACLEFHATHRTVATFSKWQVRQKISRGSIERWRNYAPFVKPLLPLLNGGGAAGTSSIAGGNPAA